MQQTLWSMQHLKQCKKMFGQAALMEERSLVSYSEDFSRLQKSIPAIVFTPFSISSLQKIVQYANYHNLSLTIRGGGLSQGGQSLALAGNAIVHMENFNQVLNKEAESIWVEANCTWSDLLEETLQYNLTPLVLPYNCHLSIAGVLSAGGIGASSFKYGTIVSNIEALEVITPEGNIQEVTEDSPLFHACLGGQGRFGIITKAKVKLRPCHNKVKTIFLLYDDKNQWVNDINTLKTTADYLEIICSPAIQGAKLSEKKRLPFAYWLYAIHASFEFSNKVLPYTANPWKMLHEQQEPIKDYFHRHDMRFAGMKKMGQWDMKHIWYECFIDGKTLFSNLNSILDALPLYYANILQIVPISTHLKKGFFILPDGENIYAMMILNPGISDILVPGCLETIKHLDERFFKEGGKRYLSGYLGNNLTEEYWKRHFGEAYSDWIGLKNIYDPNFTFSSVMFDTKSP